MIGIYKYINKLNNKCYIGQSVDIERRKYYHWYSSQHEKTKDYNMQLHQAIRKYGIENFDFEVLVELTSEEYSRELLNQLEKFYIKQFNSYKNGYNATEGGDARAENAHKGSKNGRALLIEEDVCYIRECYNAHISFKQVFSEYQDKISKSGFQKIWWFKTWKDISPEYYTEENLYWHSHQAKANNSKIAANNTRKFSKDQVLIMRQAYDNGMSPKQIQQKFAPETACSTIYNIITRKTYKDIQ